MKSLETTKNEFTAKYALSLDDVETIVLSAQKTTHKEIADERKIITLDGVVARLRKIFVKTGTSNRIELAVLAAKEDFI
jgi:DNA-binding NarL/FixJ family response regulator